MSAILNRYEVSLNTFFENEEEVEQFAKDQVHETRTILIIIVCTPETIMLKFYMKHHRRKDQMKSSLTVLFNRPVCMILSLYYLAFVNSHMCIET